MKALIALITTAVVTSAIWLNEMNHYQGVAPIEPVEVAGMRESQTKKTKPTITKKG